eukprot:6168917-Amphidinium_carterae.1
MPLRRQCRCCASAPVEAQPTPSRMLLGWVTCSTSCVCLSSLDRSEALRGFPSGKGKGRSTRRGRPSMSPTMGKSMPRLVPHVHLQ